MSKRSTDLDFKAALNKLYTAHPAARAIRRGTCDCSRRALMLSFRLPIPVDDPGWLAREESLNAEGQQTCGYYCAACGFANAGTRATVSMLGDDVP